LSDTLIVEPSRAGHKSSGRKEYKDEQLFARLIGAAVLLALAVIVLPFVLDGSGTQREYDYAESIPVEPPRPVVEKSYSSRQTQPALTADQVSVRVPDTTSLTGMTPIPTDPLPNIETTPVAAPVPGNTSAVNNSAVVPQSGLETSEIMAGWNVQVASFVSDANAIKLVKRLQAQNLPVYANRVQGSSRSVVRVMVGPFSNQIDALANRNKIDQDYKVESMIVQR